MLGWKDVRWCQAVRLLHAGDNEPATRLGCGHRPLGKSRWDDAIQATVSEHADEPWQCAAQDRETWHAMEKAFIARVTRMAPDRVEAIPEAATCSQIPRPSPTGSGCEPCGLPHRIGSNPSLNYVAKFASHYS